MQVVDVHPKSGDLLVESTDVLYVKELLAETAKEYDLEPTATRKLRYDCFIPGRPERYLFNWSRAHPVMATYKSQSFGARHQRALTTWRDRTQQTDFQGG